MQLFPQTSSLFIKKHILISWHLNEKYHITNNPPTCLPCHTWHQETQRSRDTVGLVPPSLCNVGNLLVLPKNASHTLYIQHSSTHILIQRHMLVLKHTCTHNHTLFFPFIPPRSRGMLFDQKHFLCICCPPSDDF